MKPATLRTAVASTAALLVLVAYLFTAWSSVRGLLADDAQARLSAWGAHSTPWRWVLSRSGDVVWPGSTGFERREALVPALSGTIPDGNADLSLDLRGEAIDLSLVDGALLRIDAKQPVRVSLLAGPGAGSEVAAGSVAAPGGVVRLERATGSRLARTSVLRLHMEAAPGTHVVLHFVALSPRSGVQPAACGWNLECDAPVPVFHAWPWLIPEATLAWRDQVLRARPAAIIAPAGDGASPFAADVRSTLGGWFAWLLSLTPVFVGVMSRVRGREPAPAMAMVELALVFAPWLLLQWIGWPGDDAPASASWILVGSLVGALMLRPLSPSMVVGDAAAWRAALKFLAAAACVIGLLALVNAFDADGFVARPVSATKAWQYPLWALVQQAILLRAIAPRMRLATGNDVHGALFAGALFGALHLPNFALMVATFAAGTAWAAIGRRHPALLPLAAVHAVAGIALVWAAPDWLLRSAEIGGRYLMAP